VKSWWPNSALLSASSVGTRGVHHSGQEGLMTVRNARAKTYVAPKVGLELGNQGKDAGEIRVTGPSKIFWQAT